jgi:formylglycine-generating enzyme
MNREEMVPIPAGFFTMGSAEFYADEGPLREVQIESFAIDRGPVTVARFATFIEKTGYLTVAERPPDPDDYPDADPSRLVEGSAVFQPTSRPVPLNDPSRWWAYVPSASWRHPWGPGTDNTNRQDHPVTHIAYEDAVSYAKWVGKELPSEAEWEYAARGGLDGPTFAWGDEAYPGGLLMANFWQGEFPWRNTGARGWRGTTPVGLFPANGYGLYDMTGNVWEWTSDYGCVPDERGDVQFATPVLMICGRCRSQSSCTTAGSVGRGRVRGHGGVFCSIALSASLPVERVAGRESCCARPGAVARCGSSALQSWLERRRITVGADVRTRRRVRADRAGSRCRFGWTCWSCARGGAGDR